MPNMNDVLRQAAVMQRKLSKLQEEAATKTYEAASAVEGGDIEMLQDLIIAAVNEANRISRETLEREMSNLSGGIHLPGIF